MIGWFLCNQLYSLLHKDLSKISARVKQHMVLKVCRKFIFILSYLMNEGYMYVHFFPHVAMLPQRWVTYTNIKFHATLLHQSHPLPTVPATFSFCDKSDLVIDISQKVLGRQFCTRYSLFVTSCLSTIYTETLKQVAIPPTFLPMLWSKSKLFSNSP